MHGGSGDPATLSHVLSLYPLESPRIVHVIESGNRALAKFHSVTAAFAGTEVEGRGGSGVRRWWTHGEQLLGQLEAMFAGHGADEDLAFLRCWHADLVREWPLSRVDTLPMSWVHGDFHGRNVVFAGTMVRGIFDFDLLHLMRSRLEQRAELARALMA